VGAMAEGPEAMVVLELTAELRAAILEAESAGGAPLSSLTKADKAGALWNALGDGEPGVTGFPRSVWGRLATALILASPLAHPNGRVGS
jgi:hypothetical protein